MSFNKRNCGGKITSTGSFELIKSVANYSKSNDIVHTREWLDLIEKDQNMIKGQTDQGSFFSQIADHDLIWDQIL